MCEIELCDSMLFLCPNGSLAAGFDFEGGSNLVSIDASMSATVVSIPIIADLNSNEGTECFLVQLSVHSFISNLDRIAVSMGEIREATVCIRDEIILFFPEENLEVLEGSYLNLPVHANTAGNQDFDIIVKITGSHGQMSCKLSSANDLMEKT